VTKPANDQLTYPADEESYEAQKTFPAGQVQRLFRPGHSFTFS
jgi:hypothetical protein